MRYVMTTVLAAILAAPMLGGCGDKAIKTEDSQPKNPITGTVTNEKQTTYQRSDGSTYSQTQTQKSN
jgi:hypothetical protein